MLLTLCSGAFPLVFQGTNHAAFDQLACGVFLVNFRRRYVGAQFWDPGAPKLEPSEAVHTQRRGYAFALGAHSKWDLFSLRAAPPRHITPRTGVGTYRGGITGSSGAPYRRRHGRRHRRFLAGGKRGCSCDGRLCVRVDRRRRQQAAGAGILAALLDGVLQLEGC
jgi:hypothetical protein